MRKIAVSVLLIIAALGGLGAAIAIASGPTTATNVACATATLPAHTIADNGSGVYTISGTSTTSCNTQTYTIPTSTTTVTATGTTSSTTTTATSTTSSTSTTATTPTTTTTSTTPTPTPTNWTVPCPLTHAAGADPNTSCWATHTGVVNGTGVTEAQIKANPTAVGFTVYKGDLVIAQSNVVVDHEWIQGCVQIADGANNVTIKNSLITPNGDACAADDAGGSAVNTGQGPNIGKHTLIEDTTIDGGNPGYGSHTAGITVDAGEVLRVNLFGFAQGFISDSNTAQYPALFQDDYGHNYNGCSHDDGTWFNSSSYVTFEHGWVMTNDPTQPSSGEGCSTGALAGGSDYGPQDHVVFDSSYGEGVTGEDAHAGCGSTNSAYTNNALSTDGKDYLSGFQASDTGNAFTGNTVAETGAALSYQSGFGC